ncbi:MAG: Fe-S cluster assembly ATPase SufC [Candidatus Acidifodinimicrobium sp.]
MENRIDIEKLSVRIKEKNLLKEVSLHVKTGETHILMGPNGSGKTTLARAILGDKKYTVTEGRIKFNGTDMLGLKPHERARLGIFVSFQEPVTLQGVNTLSFLKASYESINSTKIAMSEFKNIVGKDLQRIGLSESINERHVNEGFSGGEKKKFELLQLLLLKPKIAILDEIDTGLDLDAMKALSNAVNEMLPETGFLIITHNDRVLKHIKPTLVHVMKEGGITRSGGVELVEEIEKGGYKID